MTDVRWTGREGEKAFSLRCTIANITCIKADEDDLGWDYIIHFPAQSPVHIPIDQRSAGPDALVQIKATKVDAHRWSISLQNALSLARSPLPAFIVCVGIGADGKHVFRAVHLWREAIARILRAARKAHVEGDEATNHRSISFDLGPATERADILGWMRGEIDTVGERQYAGIKQSLVETLGFEDGHGVGRVRFSSLSSDKLLDLQLGLLDSVDVEHFSFTPQRFGIQARTPEVEFSGGTLEVTPKGRGGTLRLRSAGGRQAFLPAEFFVAMLPGSRRTKGGSRRAVSI